MTRAVLPIGLTLACAVLATALASTAPPATPPAAGAPAQKAGVANPQQTIVRATFDKTRGRKVDATSFRSEVGPTSKHSGAYAGMTYRKDDRGSGYVVRTKLAKGKTIHSAGEGRGNILVSKLPGSYDTACMSYDVRFGVGFDFAAGGKLPGFVGVAPGVAPSTPEDGGSTAHGWSGRLMWLGPTMWKFVRVADRSNMLVTYFYHPGQKGKYGDNVSWGSSFHRGTWHRVKQCHVMNTVGQANGVLQTWFDGRLVRNDHDVVYRTDKNVHITHVDWSIFRGGASSDWAASSTGYVDVDNLTITAR